MPSVQELNQAWIDMGSGNHWYPFSPGFEATPNSTLGAWVLREVMFVGYENSGGEFNLAVSTGLITTRVNMGWVGQRLVNSTAS